MKRLKRLKEWMAVNWPGLVVVMACFAWGITALTPQADAQALAKLKSLTQTVDTDGGILTVANGATCVCADDPQDGGPGTTAWCGGDGLTVATGTTVCLNGCDWRCWCPTMNAGYVGCRTRTGTATLRIQTAERTQ